MTALRLHSNQIIGFGLYANVYRISQRRVVKVYDRMHFTEDQREGLMADEVQGSQTIPLALPVLGIMDVIVYGVWERDYVTTRGLLKRYLPLDVTAAMLHGAGLYGALVGRFDIKPANFRMDTRGNIFLVDTQTIDCKNYLTGGCDDTGMGKAAE